MAQLNHFDHSKSKQGENCFYTTEKNLRRASEISVWNDLTVNFIKPWNKSCKFQVIIIKIGLISSPRFSPGFFHPLQAQVENT